MHDLPLARQIAGRLPPRIEILGVCYSIRTDAGSLSGAIVRSKGKLLVVWMRQLIAELSDSQASEIEHALFLKEKKRLSGL